MIQVTVRLLGPAVEWVGDEVLSYHLMPPAQLATLIELLHIKYPRLAQRAAFLRYAVNNEYATPDHALADGDEVGIIPPVAGGSADLVRLTHACISVAELAPLVTTSACGGVVTFEGIVREETQADRPLVALEYSAYDAMAIKLMNALRDGARTRFAIHDAAIAHRLGRLEIGECSVAIVVVAAHRGDAFDACRWLIDTLKKDVPIWKKEIWSAGSPTWVDPTPEDSGPA